MPARGRAAGCAWEVVDRCADRAAGSVPFGALRGSPPHPSTRGRAGRCTPSWEESHLGGRSQLFLATVIVTTCKLHNCNCGELSSFICIVVKLLGAVEPPASIDDD
eukprot:gene8132-biopygen1561